MISRATAWNGKSSVSVSERGTTAIAGFAGGTTPGVFLRRGMISSMLGCTGSRSREGSRP